MLPYHSYLTYALYSVWHLYGASVAGFITSFYQIFSSNCKCFHESCSLLQMLWEWVPPFVKSLSAGGRTEQINHTSSQPHSDTPCKSYSCKYNFYILEFHMLWWMFPSILVVFFLTFLQYELLLWPALHHAVFLLVLSNIHFKHILENCYQHTWCPSYRSMGHLPVSRGLSRCCP